MKKIRNRKGRNSASRRGAAIWSPQWNSRGKSPSFRRRQASVQVVGAPYDRDPCPQTLVTWDSVPDVMRPDDPHRRIARRTYTPCARPAGHVHEKRVVPVGKRGETITVPDDLARLHADGTGRTW